MSILNAIILGLIQGLTEFIPVSSSGHLVIAEHFLGIASVPVFDQLINLGTFLALLVYFRKRIWEITLKVVVKHDVRLMRNILISALPVGVLGLLFSGFIELPVIQNAWVVATTLTIVGLLMVFANKLPRSENVDSADRLSVKRASLIGLAQSLALLPGVSRSGSTILAGRVAGLSYEKAAEYSFLLSIPVMAAVVLKGFVGHEGRQFIATNTMSWAVGNLVAFVSGMVAVGFMLRFLARGDLKGFGYYRIALAMLVVLGVTCLG
jgi:undecaprenyl-diphosphatase